MRPSDDPRPETAAAPLTVPAEIVGHLRRGLHLELGGAAQAIEVVSIDPTREAHPELYGCPLKRLDAIRALLDLIGWGRAEPPSAIQVDLHEHRWALMTALRSALCVQEDALVDVTTGRETDQAKRIAIIEDARALRAFVAVAEDRVSVLGGRCRHPG